MDKYLRTRHWGPSLRSDITEKKEGWERKGEGRKEGINRRGKEGERKGGREVTDQFLHILETSIQKP